MDWELVQKIRGLYFSGKAQIDNYWQSQEVLEAYHETLAQRILWKWQEVFRLLKREGLDRYFTEVESVLDWGCGTGVAVESLLEVLPSRNSLSQVFLYDRSPISMAFARNRLKAKHESVGFVDGKSPAAMSLVSHVLSEMNPSQIKTCLSDIAGSQVILWLEPGTKDCSQKLSMVRQQLMAQYRVLAPCTHQRTCPFSLGDDDWCHFFAEPPSFIFQSSYWREFSDRLNIDLHTLPLSFLFMIKKEMETAVQLDEEDGIRCIGPIRKHKAYSEVVGCDAEGLCNIRFLKSRHKAKLKQMKKDSFALLTESSVKS